MADIDTKIKQHDNRFLVTHGFPYEYFTRKFYGTSRDDAIAKETCVRCEKETLVFPDISSREYYLIWGYCTECQKEFHYLKDPTSSTANKEE
jgi:hypothetical protein